MLVRLTGERPWEEIDSRRAMLLIESTLKRLVANEEIELPPLGPGGAQKILSIDLDPVTIKPPADGFEAKRQGFLIEENPFPPHSRKHEAWAKAHARPDWKDLR
jgi:hypothetical protein